MKPKKLETGNKLTIYKKLKFLQKKQSTINLSEFVGTDSVEISKQAISKLELLNLYEFSKTSES
jgi:hypothetical protein